MARLTASGAPSGAAAWPKRRRACVPGTVGPEAGKGFAFAEDAIAAKTTAPIRILGLRGYTNCFGACPMPQDARLPRRKSTWPDFVETFFKGFYDVAAEYFMLYKCCPSAVITRLTPKSMPHLDFREALSTPEEKLFSPPATVTASSAAPLDKKTSAFARSVRLSRSTWTNIFFVTIASVGGLACAFYFFNGGELLRAAAAWPSEFLYPRPLSTEKIDIGAQLNPVDKFANNEAGSTKRDEAQAPVGKNVEPSVFSLPDTTIAASNPTVTAPVGSGTPLPPTPPSFPPPPSIPGGVDVPSVPDTDSLFQTLYQTTTSIVPKKAITRTARSTRSSTRRKVSSAQQKVATQTKSTTSVARSMTQSMQQTMQQTSSQAQAPTNAIQAPSQMTMGGGLGAAPGGAVGGVGSSLGGAVGGLGGTVGGIVGGHH